jgi:hypothetical protein
VQNLDRANDSEDRFVPERRYYIRDDNPAGGPDTFQIAVAQIEKPIAVRQESDVA